LNKEEMIRKLVAHSVNTALAESKHYWLSELFEKGFTGYRNLSRGQLLQELQMRGLEGTGDPYTHDDDLDLDALDAEDYDDHDVGFGMRTAGAE
jgi:hypothetical protein